MSVIGLVIIAKTQKRRRRQIYQLGISNLGNVRSRYELRVEEPMGALEFQFTLNGVKLPQRPVPQATKTVAEAAIAPPASARSPASPAREGVGQRAGQAMRTGSAITKIVSSISAILPRSLGAPLQRAIRPVRKAQSTASRVTRLPTKVTRVMPAPSPTRSTAPPTRAPARPQTVPVTLAPHLVGETWSQTPFAEPGKTLTIDLLIAPLNPYQTRNYSFKVISRSLDQEDPPLVVEEGSVQIVGISWFRRLLPYLIFTLSSTLVIATAVLVVGFLLANLGAWER